jgi:hypothetical protein
MIGSIFIVEDVIKWWGRYSSVVSELNLRQDKLEEKVVKVEEGLNQIRGERLDQQKRMEVEIKKVKRNCKR